MLVLSCARRLRNRFRRPCCDVILPARQRRPEAHSTRRESKQQGPNGRGERGIDAWMDGLDGDGD